MLKSPFSMSSMQKDVVDGIVRGIDKGLESQLVLGITGSGKTFVMANIVAQTGLPALVVSHNKTLAAQLASEFCSFFPENSVNYFVSYYDYYQPEAYLPASDIYIEKDALQNKDLERLRHATTHALLSRKDTIVVSSVSCLYGLGNPELYQQYSLDLQIGQQWEREELLKQLHIMRYERNSDLQRGTYRVRGDCIEIYPVDKQNSFLRVFFDDNEIEYLEYVNESNQEKTVIKEEIIFPATHYNISQESLQSVLGQIKKDLAKESSDLEKMGLLEESVRLKRRVAYDIEMIKEIGYCKGIENYSYYFSGKKSGESPYTLLDYFKGPFLVFIDESHVTLPQIRAMYKADRLRKDNLVRFGFRLKAAYDNRPLTFEEFFSSISQSIFVSATPGNYEKEIVEHKEELIVRPTGVLDPPIQVQPLAFQIEDLKIELLKEININGRCLVLTLTKKSAENVCSYLNDRGFLVSYLHSEVDTLERIETIKKLRMGEIDIIVGVNLLREGLDIPEVTLVAILDADKEGFLRNETSLLQMIGRASRNPKGRVILFADRVSRAIESTLAINQARREFQQAYNDKYGIKVQIANKNYDNYIDKTDVVLSIREKNKRIRDECSEDIEKVVKDLEKKMNEAVKALDFDKAIIYRDKIKGMKKI